MIRLHRFDQYSILLWWSKRPSAHRQDLLYVAEMARSYQVDPQDLAIPKLRRFIRKLLRRHRLIPTNRPPTDADYQAAKETFLEWWYGQDII